MYQQFTYSVTHIFTTHSRSFFVHKLSNSISNVSNFFHCRENPHYPPLYSPHQPALNAGETPKDLENQVFYSFFCRSWTRYCLGHYLNCISFFSSHSIVSCQSLRYRLFYSTSVLFMQGQPHDTSPQQLPAIDPNAVKTDAGAENQVLSSFSADQALVCLNHFLACIIFFHPIGQSFVSGYASAIF